MKMGWPKGNINLKGLRFADDLALSAELTKFRKPILLQDIWRKIGLNFLKKKTEIIPTNPLFANKKIRIGEQEI